MPTWMWRRRSDRSDFRAARPGKRRELQDRLGPKIIRERAQVGEKHGKQNGAGEEKTRRDRTDIRRRADLVSRFAFLDGVEGDGPELKHLEQIRREQRSGRRIEVVEGQLGDRDG